MHPFVKNRLNIPREYEQYFVDVSDFRKLMIFLFVTDILISDYSSLVYEFAVFKRPMIFMHLTLKIILHRVIFMSHTKPLCQENCRVI